LDKIRQIILDLVKLLHLPIEIQILADIMHYFFALCLTKWKIVGTICKLMTGVGKTAAFTDQDKALCR